MANEKVVNAQVFFDSLHAHQRVQEALEDIIDSAVPVDDYFITTYDAYDKSVEFKEAAPDMKLTGEQQKVLWDLGFAYTYLCHTDGYETFYSPKQPQGVRRKKDLRDAVRSLGGG